MILLLISFVAGLLTVLAPCVLPLLPVIVGESISGQVSKKRTLVIIGSLGISLFLFTFLLKVSTIFLHVPEEIWSYISGGLLILFGLVTLFPGLWERFALANEINKKSNQLMGQGYLKKNFFGDALIGAALGPVFSTCSPTYFLILATILPVSLALGVLYLTVYIIGLCLALFGIALVGQHLVNRLGLVADSRGWFKRIIAILFIGVGLFVITGYDKKIEAYLLSNAGVFDVTRIEQGLLSAQTNQNQNKNTAADGTGLTVAEKALTYSHTPELAKIDGYLNTDGKAIKISDFIGKKVILIDFWTYSCINCQRTIPYLNEWYKKYKDEGLIIIGVHTPEFAFEHLQSNVADALQKFGIEYPVVLDNSYGTWNAFSNQYWPRKYLIDIDGFIVYDHSGEGEYEEAEHAIQKALAERAVRLGEPMDIASSTVEFNDPNLQVVQSPETYFGWLRNEFLGNGITGIPGSRSYSFPKIMSMNKLYLDGTWNIDREYATASNGARISYTYSAHDVYFVASSPTPITITILRDGKSVGEFAGADVDPKTSTATINGDRLYHLVHDSYATEHTIEIQINGEGLKAYTFTFG